jgi:phosphoribosylamine--glycine ligase
MKVLVIGSGGREHALAWKLKQSPAVREVCAAPGNPGVAALGRCIQPVDSTPKAYLDIAEAIDADLTVVGPEAPLVGGVVDAFRRAGRRIIGPTSAAAKLEGSKVFSKHFMIRHGIPTARAVAAATRTEAREALRGFSYPVVLKYDGLAAGKGVIIAGSESEAEQGLARLPSGAIVVEEFLEGEEVSFIAVVAGAAIIPLEATQDHKAIFDGDRGPNTGGMGAYCDGRILTAAQVSSIMERIIEPAVAGLKSDGAPFSGFLYAGLMMTAEGPKVLEYNVRMGDPETQPLMHRLEGDLLAVLLGEAQPRWKDDPSVCVVLAAHGYPGVVRTGDLIEGVDSCPATVFHAGTRLTERGLETAGGRVLGVTASGPTLEAAINNTYDAVRRIHFEGMQFRSDIGRKGLKRWQAGSALASR